MQLRAYGCRGISEQPVDIDIGIVKKSELALYGSHDAIGDKLNWVKENLGEDKYDQTIANIVMAKQVLKQGQAYKKVEHGGIGGIGVENWILLHGGNIEEAFRSFRQAAVSGDKYLPLHEFKSKYRVLDAGINVQKLIHENYIDKLTESGYQNMLKTIDDFFKGRSEEVLTEEREEGSISV